jgi:hypothetical protein
VADETLISRRVFKATDPYEVELPREQGLKVKDLKEAYLRAARNREVRPNERVVKAFMRASGTESSKLDLSLIQFWSRDDVVAICDVLHIARGLEVMILDYCDLSDEQLREFLSALLCLPCAEHQHSHGITRLSLVGNHNITMEGWRALSFFVHMVLPQLFGLT